VGKKGCLAIVFSIIFIVGASTQANAFWELLFHYGMYAGQAITKLSKDDKSAGKTSDQNEKEKDIAEAIKDKVLNKPFAKGAITTVAIGDIYEIQTFNDQYSAITYNATFRLNKEQKIFDSVFTAVVEVDKPNKMAYFRGQIVAFENLEEYKGKSTDLANYLATSFKNDAIKAKPQSAAAAQPNAPNPSPGN
jgi:hypothetical protein